MATLHQKLSNGGRVFGTFVQYMVNPQWSDLFPPAALDFVIMNAEHNPLTMADFVPLATALQMKGIAPLLRLHTRDPELAAKACDSGFAGVVLPYVEDVDELKQCILRAKHRPLNGAAGRRLIETGVYPSEKSRRYIEDKNQHVFVAAMVESVEAMENLDAICSVAGLDAVFVGPNDLTISMGIPEERDNPEFVDAMQTILRIAARHGVPAGGHFSKIEHTVRTIKQGARFIPHGSDLRTVQSGFPEMMSRIRGPLAKAPEERVI